MIATLYQELDVPNEIKLMMLKSIKSMCYEKIETGVTEDEGYALVNMAVRCHGEIKRLISTTKDNGIDHGPIYVEN